MSPLMAMVPATGAVYLTFASPRAGLPLKPSTVWTIISPAKNNPDGVLFAVALARSGKKPPATEPGAHAPVRPNSGPPQQTETSS